MLWPKVAQFASHVGIKEKILLYLIQFDKTNSFLFKLMFRLLLRLGHGHSQKVR